MKNESFLNLPKEVREAIDEADTAFATLNIGRDHGITPQAEEACREAWAKIRGIIGGFAGTPDEIRRLTFRNSYCK